MTTITDLHDESSDRAVSCQNCEWEGEEHEVGGIADLLARISPGELVPVGECPKCGSLCHYSDLEVIQA